MSNSDKKLIRERSGSKEWKIETYEEYSIESVLSFISSFKEEHQNEEVFIQFHPPERAYDGDICGDASIELFSYQYREESDSELSKRLQKEEEQRIELEKQRIAKEIKKQKIEKERERKKYKEEQEEKELFLKLKEKYEK